jgi:LEA14-like dessication related protein
MLWSVLSGIILLAGCSRPEEDPVFLGVRNIKVSKVQNTTAFLNAEAHFHNPNDMKMVLRKIDVDVEMEGEKIGSINQTTKIRIPAVSDFKIPLDATVNLGNAGVLNNLMGMLGGKKMKVRYNGHIRVTMHGIPMRIPVDYEDEIRIR